MYATVRISKPERVKIIFEDMQASSEDKSWEDLANAFIDNFEFKNYTPFKEQVLAQAFAEEFNGVVSDKSKPDFDESVVY
jgi:hypothetical protein